MKSSYRSNALWRASSVVFLTYALADLYGLRTGCCDAVNFDTQFG